MAPNAPARAPFVAVCTPIWDCMEPPTQRALRALRVPGGWRAVIVDTHGVDVAQARRMLTEIALEIKDKPDGAGVSHILFVDADMTFGSDALLRLHGHGLDIVSGLCFERRYPYNPVMFSGGKPILKYPQNEVIEVESCGAAFLLVRREVFDDVEAAFPGHSWWNHYTGESEDEKFIERAVGCGYKVFVDTGCKVGHIGKVVIDESFAKRNGSLGGL